MYKLIGNDGRLIDARFELVSEGDKTSIIIESKGGAAGSLNSRNPDYNLLVGAIFLKVAENGLLITQIILDSTPVQKLPIQERVLQLGHDYPINLSILNVEKFRKLVGKKVSSMHQAPGTKSNGNSQRRIRISLDRAITPSMLGAQEIVEEDNQNHRSTPNQEVPFDRSGSKEAKEGFARRVMALHRKRERSIRKEKIAEQLAKGEKLSCQVPGCGFDFQMVYGDLGKEYAHVHHLRPLSARDGDEITRLEDLAIVCANCHAMIHRGRQCRPLEGLIP